MLEVLGRPHRGGCRDTRRDEVLRIWEARHFERPRVKCACAERVGAQRDIVERELQRLGHLLGVEHQTERLGALLQLAAVVYREVALDPQALIEFGEYAVLQIRDENQAVVGSRARDIDDELSEIGRRDDRVQRARADKALARVVAMRVALVFADDPRKEPGLAVLGDHVKFHTAAPEHVRVNVESADDRARSLGTVAEHRRGEQAVVRWQQPLHGLSVDDLEGEEGGVWLNDEAHVRIGARASVYDVALESQRQLAEHGAALGRGRDLGRHDHLLGSLDIAS